MNHQIKLTDLNYRKLASNNESKMEKTCGIIKYKLRGDGFENTASYFIIYNRFILY